MKPIKCFTTLALIICMMAFTNIAVAHAATYQGYNTAAVLLNGTQIQLEPPAVLVNGATLVPMKVLFVALDPSVNTEWNTKEQSVTAKWDNNTLRLVIGEKQANLNGNKIDIPVPPQLIDGSTYVPLKVVAESFGAKVEWDGTNQRVLITTAATPATQPTPTNPNTPVIQVNGNTVAFKTAPIVLQDKIVLVSINEMLEAIDPRIKIEGEGDTYTIKWGTPERTFTFKLNDTEEAKVYMAYVDWEKGVAPQMVNGVVMVPMELLAAAFNTNLAKVNTWRQVGISTPKLAEAWGTTIVTDYANSTLNQIMQSGKTFDEARQIFEYQVFLEVNKLREEAGVPSLIWDDRLQTAARLHSEDQLKNNFTGHTGSDGSSPTERVKRQGWSGPTGENCYAGTNSTPLSIVQAWYRSPGHKLPMMSDAKEPYYTGVGIYCEQVGASPDGIPIWRESFTIKFAVIR